MNNAVVRNSKFDKEYFFVDIQEAEEYIRNMSEEQINFEFSSMLHYLETSRCLTYKMRIALIELLHSKIK